MLVKSFISRYRYTIILLLSIVFFIFIAQTQWFTAIIWGITEMSYLGIFIVGILFVSIFTVTPASIILFRLSDQLDPLAIALIGGVGAMVGDFIIFRYLRDGVYLELRPLFVNLGNSQIFRIFKNHYFTWLTPVLGAFIIASPLPDELGIALLGGTRIRDWQLLLLSYLLNTGGIFIIIEILKKV